MEVRFLLKPITFLGGFFVPDFLRGGGFLAFRECAIRLISLVIGSVRIYFLADFVGCRKNPEAGINFQCAICRRSRRERNKMEDLAAGKCYHNYRGTGRADCLKLDELPISPYP